MKRFVPGLFLILLLSGCNHESKVTIRGSLSEERDGVIYLDRSEVNYNSRIDSAVIKRGRFRFVMTVFLYSLCLGHPSSKRVTPWVDV